MTEKRPGVMEAAMCHIKNYCGHQDMETICSKIEVSMRSGVCACGLRKNNNFEYLLP